MAHNNRKPKMLPFTVKDFQKQFPDDATCLEWLKNYLYPDGIFCEAYKASPRSEPPILLLRPLRPSRSPDR